MLVILSLTACQEGLAERSSNHLQNSSFSERRTWRHGYSTKPHFLTFGFSFMMLVPAFGSIEPYGR